MCGHKGGLRPRDPAGQQLQAKGPDLSEGGGGGPWVGLWCPVGLSLEPKEGTEGDLRYQIIV